MKRFWDIDERTKHWCLRFGETRLLKNKPARNHLPFAVQFKFYQKTERFPSTINEFPETLLHYSTDQLEADVSGILVYVWSGRTEALHRR
ncbi:DUF4158 domain-containing protein [Escherichia coli]|nr:DUF4158 domain-containing protein [Escherichia coli]HEI2791205.1 DUF4158 domain-containing protein [Escherichia coli]HEI3622159.1 DUF4158 domain-containing protein [Escherichia coli]HEI3672425.1 DUF4158 domain-containing protein [Escherichia coli]HEI4217574.1 DUF4158 domain-containing protein [Escherichia coli]